MAKKAKKVASSSQVNGNPTKTELTTVKNQVLSKGKKLKVAKNLEKAVSTGQSMNTSELEGLKKKRKKRKKQKTVAGTEAETEAVPKIQADSEEPENIIEEGKRQNEEESVASTVILNKKKAEPIRQVEMSQDKDTSKDSGKRKRKRNDIAKVPMTVERMKQWIKEIQARQELSKTAKKKLAKLQKLVKVAEGSQQNNKEEKESKPNLLLIKKQKASMQKSKQRTESDKNLSKDSGEASEAEEENESSDEITTKNEKSSDDDDDQSNEDEESDEDQSDQNGVEQKIEPVNKLDAKKKRYVLFVGNLTLE